jgi:hypothetical protein
MPTHLDHHTSTAMILAFILRLTLTMIQASHLVMSFLGVVNAFIAARLSFVVEMVGWQMITPSLNAMMFMGARGRPGAGRAAVERRGSLVLPLNGSRSWR